MGEGRRDTILFFLCSHHVLCAFSHVPSDISQVLNVLLKGVPNRTMFLSYMVAQSLPSQVYNRAKGETLHLHIQNSIPSKDFVFSLANQNGSLQKIITELGRHPYLIHRN